MKTKAEIRKDILEKRKSLSPEFLNQSSREIVQMFSLQERFKQAETVALYMAIAGEVQLDDLFPICWSAGKRTCIPVFNSELKIYEMAEITTESEFTAGKYGIREPVSPARIPLSEIDLITVPGVAFDKQGNRLGRGGGFYDRMLSHFPGHRIAVAFDFQIYDQVPVEKHDLPVEVIITEIKVLNV